MSLTSISKLASQKNNKIKKKIKQHDQKKIDGTVDENRWDYCNVYLFCSHMCVAHIFNYF